MKLPLSRRKTKMSETSREELSAQLFEILSEELKTVKNNELQEGGQSMSNIEYNDNQNKEVQVNFIISYNSQSNEPNNYSNNHEPQTNGIEISNEQMNSLNEDMLLLTSNQNN